MISCRFQSMLRFNNVEALKAYLVNLGELYEPYAEGMWRLGIRSTEMIANATKEDLANVLAHPEPPGPSHQIHASDLIARSRLAGMLVLLTFTFTCTCFASHRHAPFSHPNMITHTPHLCRTRVLLVDPS